MSLKTITSTVGEGGKNIPTDVATVQYLLNGVPVSMGGPLKPLKIDGFAGVLTIEAINRFQKVQRGTPNSQIQPDEAIFSRLKNFDPQPLAAKSVAPNFAPSVSQKMDPSKMDRSIGKSVEGGGIKARLYAEVKDESV